MPRLHLLDPGLLNRHGHHFHVDLAIAEACAERGLEVVVAGHRRVEPEIAAELPVLPVFRAPAYPSRDGASRRRFRRDFDVLNRFVAHDLARRVTPPAADDVVLVPTARNLHLSGMLRWYLALPEPRPRIGLRLLFEPGFRVDPGEVALAHELTREQMRAWAAVPGGRVALFAERRRLADLYAELSGMPVGVLPMPIRYPGRATQPRRKSGRHVVFVGEARREKGFALLPEACRRVLDEFPDTRFTIQASCLLDVGPEMVRELAALAPAVRLLERPLTVGEYGDLMASADLVLAPYDPETYRFRTSQIALEAMGLGKPVITTRGTWMHEHLRRLGADGYAARAFSAAGVAAAVADAFTRWVEVEAAAARASVAAQRQHNAGAFVDGLLAAIDGAPR